MRCFPSSCQLSFLSLNQLRLELLLVWQAQAYPVSYIMYPCRQMNYMPSDQNLHSCLRTRASPWYRKTPGGRTQVRERASSWGSLMELPPNFSLWGGVWPHVPWKSQEKGTPHWVPMHWPCSGDLCNSALAPWRDSTNRTEPSGMPQPAGGSPVQKAFSAGLVRETLWTLLVIQPSPLLSACPAPISKMAQVKSPGLNIPEV